MEARVRRPRRMSVGGKALAIRIVRLQDSLLRKTSDKIREYQQQEGGVPGPAIGDLAKMVQTALWAGIRQEEGRRLRFGLAYVPADKCPDPPPIRFKSPLSLDVETVVRLAPAVIPKGSRLGIQRQEGNVKIWGVAQVLPACLR